jgi:hypothetical protein
MSGRPSRKAAQAVSYVQDAAETSEDESMSSEDEGSRSKKKKPGAFPVSFSVLPKLTCTRLHQP